MPLFISFDLKKWLVEGFILQKPSGRGYWLGHGPFVASSTAGLRSLYCPDFFLQKAKPWLTPAAVVEIDALALESFLQRAFEGESVEGFVDKRGSDRGFSNRGFSDRGFSDREISDQSFSDRSFSDRGIFKNLTPPSFVVYQEIFFRAKQLFQSGQLKKLVPAFYESFDLSLFDLPLREEGEDPFINSSCISDLGDGGRKPSTNSFIKSPIQPQWTLLKRLFKNSRSLSAHGFLYGIWDKRGGRLGFSPEFLFSLQGESFTSMALAGTGLYPNAPSLLKDKKELREHELVVMGLKQSLRKISWSGRLSPVYEMPFPPLKHLRTDFMGRIRPTSFDFERVSRSLHPSPALGGLPKELAQDCLQKMPLQKERRGFAAPFGFFDSAKREAFCLLSLRGMEWQRGQKKARKNSQRAAFSKAEVEEEERLKGRIFSGAGLLKESFLQKEWLELSLKRKQTRNFF